ncbi:MAG: DMT family transporter [Propionibacteriaceae bacterium]|jgi:drug/metabolite transporter (DMT)-like permease|nr:DMT family transporter [Propionibacteriaceae bacterium]
MNSPVKSSLLLTLCAMIWGFAFVAQRSGVEHIGPFLFAGSRALLGSATVYLVICLKERRLAPLKTAPWSRGLWSDPTVGGGVVCGLVLFTAGTCQQVGLVFTTASKAGFLTALYIVLVPVLGLFLGQRVRWTTWLAVSLSAVGLYLLSATGQFSIAPGDLVVIVGALFWAVHILAIDRYVHQADVLRLSCVQFLVAGVISLALAPLADGFFVPTDGALAAAFWSALPAVLFVGVLSSGIAFTAQAFGQRGAPPAAAAVIMSLEAVFATIGGFFILHERLTPREAFGCALMLAAVLLAQAPARRRARPQPPPG